MQLFITLLCVLLPIVAVIVWLNMSLKRRKRKAEAGRHAYYKLIAGETGFTSSFHVNLIYQLVILDESSRKMLVIDQNDNSYVHALFSLEEIRSVQVLNIKKIIEPTGTSGKAESFTDRIALEILPGKNGDPGKHIIFYDRMRHSIYEMSGLEKEAEQLKERIVKSKKNKLTPV